MCTLAVLWICEKVSFECCIRCLQILFTWLIFKNIRKCNGDLVLQEMFSWIAEPTVKGLVHQTF